MQRIHFPCITNIDILNKTVESQLFKCPLITINYESLSSFMLVGVGHSVVYNSFAIPWTVAYQMPLSMKFFRQEYWSSLSFPSQLEASIQGAPQDMLIIWVFLSFLKRFWLPDCLIVSHLRGRCSSDLNISNMLPKHPSFRIDNFLLKIIYLQI